MKDGSAIESRVFPLVCFKRRRFFFFFFSWLENWVRLGLRRQLKGLNWATSRVCERKPVAINKRQHVMVGEKKHFFSGVGRMFVSLNISTTEKQSKSQHASQRRLEKGSGMEKRYSTSYRLLFDWGRETNWLSCSHAFEMRITQTTWLFKAENFPLPPFS